MMGEKEILMKECVAYFRARPVYRRLFRLIREKYSGLGASGRKGDAYRAYTGGQKGFGRLFPKRFFCAEKIYQFLQR